MGEERLPQLNLMHRDLSCLPDVRLPDGYCVRRFQPGDEQAWVDVLNSTGSLGQWTLEVARERMSGDKGRVVADSIHFVTYRGMPVATACLQHHADREEGELGWVGLSLAHQGKGLGFQVCLATLHHIRSLGYTAAILSTDDQRFAAIKTYLKLGFRPVITHESHLERWRAILPRVGYNEELIDCPRD